MFPILDVLGHDAFREIDPYVAYELVALDSFMDSVRRYEDFLYEDGLCGFGAMSEEPFFYVFVDEHKIVTVRAEPGADAAGFDLIVADLDLADPEQVAAAGPPAIGFYSHVDVPTRRRAEAAGLELVVPRSRMARELPELAAGILARRP